MSTKQNTIEKLLEDVLVPQEEQPYEIPKNWKWVKSTTLFNVEYGKGLPTSKLTEEGFPVFGANGQIGFYSHYTKEHPKVLMTCRGATCGTINVSLPKSFITNNSLILSPKWDASLKYIEYLFKSVDTRKLISGSAQPQITIKAFDNFTLPLPPLSEQFRLAEKLERMLDKIDEVKNLIEEAKGTFEFRQAAIWDKAFRGELTRKWRKENKSKLQIELNNDYIKSCDIENDFYPHMNIPETWKWLRAESLFLIQPRNGYSPKSTMRVTNTKTMKLGAITKGYFINDEYKYIEEDIEKDSYLWLKKGDFLIQRANSIDYVGTAAIYTGQDNEFIYPDLIMKGRLKEEIVCPEYMVLWINSHFGKKFIKQNATGTAGNMPKINQKVVKSIPIPIPPVDEQAEILRIYHEVNKREVQLKISNAYEMVDKIKQSVLSKAFRGELGTNNPTEESAIELLKEVLQGKIK